MSKNVYGSGLKNVGSYQVSGKPFVTGSTVTNGAEQQIEFPEVSNNITVKLDSASGGVTKNGYRLNGEFRLDEKGSNYTLGNNETFVMWMNESGSTNNLHYLLRHQSPDGPQVLYNSANGAWLFGQFTADTPAFKSVAFTHEIDTMSHIVITLDNDAAMKVYINNSLKGTLDLSTHNGIPNSSLISLGTHAVNHLFSFVEVARFSTTFDPDDVSEAYNGGQYFDLNSHTKVSNLQNYWTFGDNPGDTFDNNGASAKITFTIVDTKGNSNLGNGASGLIDNDDEIVPFTHTFGGGGGELRIHYRSKDHENVTSGKHYWKLDSQNESITMNVKSKELYLSADGGDCDYSLQADLTSIPSSRMYQHTGSGVDE
jgi:hypothetical protein